MFNTINRMNADKVTYVFGHGRLNKLGIKITLMNFITATINSSTRDLIHLLLSFTKNKRQFIYFWIKLLESF